MAPVARAVVDASRWINDYDTVLAIAAEAVQRRLATVDDLARELGRAPMTGSGHLRRALASVVAGARSVAEGRALALFAGAGLPQPLVNCDLVVDGAFLARPDFRWGRLIVEIDSKEWHLLVPGSWERTQQRRRLLERAGFTVLVVTPEELHRQGDVVVADIQARLAAAA